jgi:hypothetical protein
MTNQLHLTVVHPGLELWTKMETLRVQIRLRQPGCFDCNSINRVGVDCLEFPCPLTTLELCIFKSVSVWFT